MDSLNGCDSFPQELVKDVYDQFISGSHILFLIKPPEFMKKYFPNECDNFGCWSNSFINEIRQYVKTKYPSYDNVFDREEFLSKLRDDLYNQAKMDYLKNYKPVDPNVTITIEEFERLPYPKPIDVNIVSDGVSGTKDDIKYLRKRVKYAKTPMERREYQQKLGAALKAKKKKR